MGSVADNIGGIQERIEKARLRAGRPEGSVHLLAVSKKMPSSAIREAHASGLRAFGENYAQELRDKAVELADLEPLRWHAIGPLQLNKVKYVAKVAYAFHALDSLEVAQELSKRRQGEPLRVFLEVNLGAEDSKSGLTPSEVPALLEKVRALPNLEPVGLMALPPLDDNPEHARPYFRQLVALARAEGLPELSMGTTADFEVAIEEGATWVRVGTALFGARPPRPVAP